MMKHLVSISDATAMIFFAVSLFCLRRTVLSLLDAGAVTHNIWAGIRRLSWRRRIGFAWRALRTHMQGTTDQGWSELLRTRFSKEEVTIFEEAEQMGKVPPVHPRQVVAGARTAAWGWLCAGSALIAFVSQILSRGLHWITG